MTVSYEQARAEATDYLAEADLHLARTGRLPSIPLPAELLRALLSPEGQGAPVAWRVKDFADGWILFNSEAAAKHEADAMGGALMQSLVPAPPTKGGE